MESIGAASCSRIRLRQVHSPLRCNDGRKRRKSMGSNALTAHSFPSDLRCITSLTMQHTCLHLPPIHSSDPIRLLPLFDLVYPPSSSMQSYCIVSQLTLSCFHSSGDPFSSFGRQLEPRYGYPIAFTYGACTSRSISIV